MKSNRIFNIEFNIEREKKIIKGNAKRISFLKGLIIATVLFSLVLLPIFSSADSDDSNSPAVNDGLHGYLEIYASDITIPVSSKITENQVIRLAKPTARHKGLDIGIEENVGATYSISKSDLAKLNSNKKLNEKVAITINGLYIYSCYVPSCGDVNITGSKEIFVTFSGVKYKVNFHANGGKINGKNYKRVYVQYDGVNVPVIGSSKIPSDVKREGYVFKGWSTSKTGNVKFTKDSKIQSDTNVYALWEPEKSAVVEKEEPEKIIVEKDDVTKTRNILVEIPSTDIPVTEGEQNDKGAPDKVNPSSAPINKVQFEAIAKAQNVPVASIGKGAVPLYAPQGFSGWAFVNLLLTIMSTVLVLICVAVGLKQKIDKRSLWFIVSVVGGLGSILIFFMTQNMSLNMVLTDGWTVVNMALFALVVTGVIKSLGSNKEAGEFTYNYSL